MYMPDHPWRQTMTFKGRQLRAHQLVATMRAEGWTLEEAAHQYDLPVEAVREALVWVEQNLNLVDRENEIDRIAALRSVKQP